MTARYAIAALLLASTGAAAAGAPRPFSSTVSTEAPAEVEHPRRATRLGLILGVVSVPNPASAQLFARLGRHLGAGVAVSALPASLSDVILRAANVPGAAVETLAIDAELRIFPMGGSFFLGSALGRQSLTASARKGSETATIDVITIYATPRLGWLAIWDSGFSLGLDLGVQVPLSADFMTRTTNAALDGYARSAAQLIGSTPLPSLGLRMGWML